MRFLLYLALALCFPLSFSESYLETQDFQPKGEFEGGKYDYLSDKKFDAYWRADFKVYTLKDKTTINTISSTEVYGKMQWFLFNNFSIYIQGLIIGRNGFSQSIYDREDRRSGFHFLEGFLKYKHSSDFEILFGNINQDFLQTPLLMTDKTFPGVIEKVNFYLFENLTGQWVFQQAIPDNATESVRRAPQLVSTPFFFTQSLFLNATKLPFLSSIPLLSKLTLKEKLTSFYFTNLSPAIADRGRLYGNSISHIGSDSDFKFKYYGFYNSLVLQTVMGSQWIAEFGLDFLHNLGATDTYNQGERSYFSLYHNFRDKIELKTTLEYFANQSDSSIAYYNSEIYGHNNRVGVGLKLESHFYQSGLNLGVSYRYSQPIEKLRTIQGEGHYLLVYIGTNYVSI